MKNKINFHSLYLNIDENAKSISNSTLYFKEYNFEYKEHLKESTKIKSEIFH